MAALCCHHQSHLALYANPFAPAPYKEQQVITPYRARRSRVQRNPAAVSREHHSITAAAAADAQPAQDVPPEFTLSCRMEEGERVLQGVESGDLLRDAMLAADPPVGLYTAWGKVANCSGAGGTGDVISGSRSPVLSFKRFFGFQGLRLGCGSTAPSAVNGLVSQARMQLPERVEKSARCG